MLGNFHAMFPHIATCII